MRRRKLMLLLGGPMTAAGALHAQQKAMPVIGWLDATSAGSRASYLAVFRQELSETGYVESQNLAIEYHCAEGRYDRLPALVADLVDRKVDVILSTGGVPSAVGGKKRDLDDPDHLQCWGRPRRVRPGRQSRATWRQRHGRQRHNRRADAQAARAAFRACSPSKAHRSAREPEQQGCRGHDSRRAGSGAHEGGAAADSEGRHRKRDRRRLRLPCRTASGRARRPG
jgi:hypothetical protein